MEQNTERKSFKIGEIYLMYFQGEGSEVQGLRPGVIFQNNIGNEYSPNVIALPLTTAIKKEELPTHVVLPKEIGLRADSMVMCENPTVMSKRKIGKYLATVPAEYTERLSSDFISPRFAV